MKIGGGHRSSLLLLMLICIYSTLCAQLPLSHELTDDDPRLSHLSYSQEYNSYASERIHERFRNPKISKVHTKGGTFKINSRRSPPPDLHRVKEYNRLPCPPNYYHCMNSTTCILISHICDGITNCPFGDDEGKECGSDTCKRSMCRYGCRPSQSGALCFCPEGFVHRNSVCEEQRLKLPLLLYTLPELSVIKGITLPLQSFHTSRPKPMYALGSVAALVSDATEDVAYYCDVSNYVIVQQHFHNQKREILAETGGDGCNSMALDKIGHNLYWTDRERGAIIVDSLLNFNISRAIVSVEKSHPSNLLLHLNSRTMIWLDEASHSMFKSDMDGHNMRMVPLNDGSNPTHLALDSEQGIVYWFDEQMQQINAIHLETLQNKPHIMGVKGLSGLEFYNGYLMWVEKEQPNVLVVHDVERNKSLTVTLEEINRHVVLKDVMTPANKSTVNETCPHDLCSELCLLSPKGYRCECREGYILDTSGKCIASMPHVVCSKDEFKCGNGVCIPQIYVCDTEVDCLDGSDETMCDRSHACPKGMFQCDESRCIPDSWVCNRRFDCKDLTDENHCSFNGACNFPNHSCDNGTKCIPLLHMCDGTIQCQDGTDENEDCAVLPCNQWGRCSQMCHPVQAKSYLCSCGRGYWLAEDNFTCHSKDSRQPKFLLTTGQNLKLFKQGDISAKVLISKLSRAVALDFYLGSSQSFLFWSDVRENKIYRGTLLDEKIINVTVIVEEGISFVEGLAVEWIGERIYWTDRHYHHIETARFDGSQRMTVIKRAGQPRSLAVDSVLGLLFWSDMDTSRPRIERSSLNGMHQETIVEVSRVSNGGLPSAITLDYPAKRVYWADAKTGTLHTVRYDGTNHHVIHYSPDITQPYGIGVYGDYIYWTDAYYHIFGQVNRWKGSGERVLLVEYPSIYDIKVYHSSRQPKNLRVNPCRNGNGGCSHICLAGPNATVSCHCPYGMKLARDNKTCHVQESFVVYVTKEKVVFALEDMTSDRWVYPPTRLSPLLEMRDVAFAFDPMLNMMYLGEHNVVKRKPVAGGPMETVITFNQRRILSLAIDKQGRNLYILSSSHNSSHAASSSSAFLTVSNINGEFPVDIVWENVHLPATIAVDSENRLLFLCHTVVIRNQTTSLIDVAQLDGSDRKMMVHVTICPKTMSSISRKQQLCWIESASSSVACISYGNDRIRTVSLHNASASVTAISNSLQVLFTNENIAYEYGFEKSRNLSAVATTLGSVVFAELSTADDFEGNQAHLLNCGDCETLCIPLNSGATCKPIMGHHSFLMYLQGGIPHAFPLLEEAHHQLPGAGRDLLTVAAFSSSTEDDMDFNVGAGEVYFSKQGEGVLASRLDGKHQRLVRVQDDQPISALAVDWIAGNLYWCTSKRALIQVSRLNGDHPYIIVHENLERPTALAVHPQRGLLFWSDSSSLIRIERAMLSGRGRRVIADSSVTSMKSISDLVIDYSEDMLYWADPVLSAIHQSDLDGNMMKQVLSSQNGIWFAPASIAISEKYLYWTDRSHGEGSLMAVSNTNRTSVFTLKHDLGDVSVVRLFDKHVQQGSNPCSDSNGGCEHLCLYEGHGDYSCACAFSKLGQDGRTCKDHTTFMLLAHQDRIEGISLDDPTSYNSPFPPIRPSNATQNIIDMAFGDKTDQIFFSDLHLPPGLFAIDLNGTTMKPLLNDEIVRHVEGLAYDAIHGDLYWTDSATPSICRTRISGRHVSLRGASVMERIVWLKDDDKPRGIVVDNCRLYVFWTNWQPEHPRIERAFLSGADHKVIIGRDLVRPNGIAIDDGDEMLYWVDAHLDGGYRIESSDFQGQFRKIIFQGSGHHPFDIVVYGNSLYWTDWEIGSLLKTDKSIGTGPVIVRSGLNKPKGLTIVSSHPKQCHAMDKLREHSECSGFCLNGGTCIPSIDAEEKPMCLCSEGYTGLKCQTYQQFSEEDSSQSHFKILTAVLISATVVLLLILLIIKYTTFTLHTSMFRKAGSTERSIMRSGTLNGDAASSLQGEICEEDYTLINPVFENCLSDTPRPFSWLQYEDDGSGQNGLSSEKGIALKTYLCDSSCPTVC